MEAGPIFDNIILCLLFCSSFSQSPLSMFFALGGITHLGLV